MSPVECLSADRQPGIFNAGLRVEGLLTTARYNTHELADLLADGLFPSADDPDYGEAQAAANARTFHKSWDAELRASVYLNEFITHNPFWRSTLCSSLQQIHTQLQNEKGAQLRKVIEVADCREKRFAEIIDQRDGEGVIKYYLGMLMVDAAIAPATYLLIRTARRIGEVVVMCLKEDYREARPSQVCPVIVPMIDPPDTPSFPAGHALQSQLISLCLAAAGRPQNQPLMLQHLAKRVACNRVIAGLHYPLDNDAGVMAANACFQMLQAGSKFSALLVEARDENQPENLPVPRPIPCNSDR